MEELIDILDENGNKTGKIETRTQVHENGLWHRIIVVSIIDKNGHLLMQQRSINKEVNPSKWDVSVAGHVSSGQTSIEAAIREISEELGIEINEKELKYILTYKNSRQTSKNIEKENVERFKELNLNYKKGFIIGEAELVDCIPVTKEFENDLINRNELIYAGTKNRTGYAWKLKNIKKIKPIQANGQLGIWNYNNIKQNYT